MDAALAGFLKKQIQKYEGGAEIESGKNVSFTANGTTVVQPSSGKDAMEQVTVTVNVPMPVLEANKTSTIDVSNYSEAVEITPSTNKDAMEKVTVSLSNIPDIETNKTATIDVSSYSQPVEIEPSTNKDGMAKATVSLSNIPIAGANLYAWKAGGSVVYTVTDNPELTAEIYGCISAEGISSFTNMTSDNFKIIQIVGNVLRIGSDSEHWAPYERNSDYDTDLDSIDLDSNKSVTIDVSAYTEPVEITPTAGKDGMKKATVELYGIPKIEEDKTQTIDVSEYTEPIKIYPSSGKEVMFDAMEEVTVTLSNIPNGVTLYCWLVNDAPRYLSVNTSPTGFDAYKNVKELTSERGGIPIVETLYTIYDVGYFRGSDTEFTVIDENTTETTFIRYSEGDIPIWG